MLQAAWEATRLSYSMQTPRILGSKIEQSNSTLIDNSSLHIYIPLQSSRTLFLWCFSADYQRTTLSWCMKKLWKQTPNVAFLALTPKLHELLIKAGHVSTTPSMRDESLCAIIDLKKPTSNIAQHKKLSTKSCTTAKRSHLTPCRAELRWPCSRRRVKCGGIRPVETRRGFRV